MKFAHCRENSRVVKKKDLGHKTLFLLVFWKLSGERGRVAASLCHYSIYLWISRSRKSSWKLLSISNYGFNSTNYGNCDLLMIVNIPCSSYCVIQLYPNKVYIVRAGSVSAVRNKPLEAGVPTDWRTVYFWLYLLYGPPGRAHQQNLFPFQLPAEMALKVGCALYKSLHHGRRPTQAVYTLAFSFCLCKNQQKIPCRQVPDFGF